MGTRKKKDKVDKILNKQKKEYVKGIERNIPFDPNLYVTYEADAPLAQIPAKLYSEDERADKIKYIQEIQGTDPLKSIFDKPRLTPEYVDYLKSRLQQYENVDFERFVLNTLPHDDVAAQQLLASEFPEIIETRERSIDEYTDFLRRLVEIALRGPQSKEDFFLIYNIQTGKVILPPGVLGQIFNINTKNAPEEGKDIVGRGMFNPRKYNRLKMRKETVIPGIPYPYTINRSGVIEPTINGGKIMEKSDPLKTFNDQIGYSGY